MAIEKGSAFLLKAGDGATPPVFTTVAGLRTTSVQINAEQVVVTNKGSGGWRELLEGAGVRSVTVSAAGVFTGSAAEAQIQAASLAGMLGQYRLAFESGATLTGQFLIARLDHSGDFNGERSYALTLESSGEVVAA